MTAPFDGGRGPEVLAFLQKDSEMTGRFLENHFARMWTRFNFFMVATTALALGLFQGLRDGKGLPASLPYPIAGTLLALCWYVYGAQDRYLVEAYRAEIGRVFRAIGERLPLPDSPTYAAVGDVKGVRVKGAVYQWRLESLSTTKLVSLFPLLALVGWLALIAKGMAG
jgi:hypothetical protein